MRRSVYAITAVFLLALAGCDLTTGPDSGQSAVQDGKAAVSLAIAGTDARTVAPAHAELADVKTWKLWGVKNEEPPELLLESDDPENEPLHLETGDWDFTLEGHKDGSDNTLILEGTITEKAISLEGPNTLNFIVAPVLEGTGTVRITINLPDGHGINQVKVFKGDELLDTRTLTPEVNSVVYENTDHAAGNYYYSFRLYKGDPASPNPDLYGVVSELVKVRANLTSEGTYTLEKEDLNLSYLITFHLNGGAFEGDYPASYRSTDADLTLPTPATRPGYEFGGWYDNQGLAEDPVTKIPQDNAGDKPFWAKWTPLTYNINYELNGGSGNGGNPATYTVEDLPLTLNNPTHDNEDLAFLRWYVDGSADIAVPTIPEGSTGEKTFYAKWTLVYAIEYELNGGNNHDENPLTYNVESPAITLKNPTRDEYSFMGWYDNDGFSNDPITTIPTGSTDPKEFYARWHQNGQSLASAADLRDYIIYAAGGDSAANPVILPPVTINLADGGWTDLLTAISGAGKYVALDLSACTMGDNVTAFDPGAANTGESKIVSLVLPDAATSVKAGEYANPPFRFFTALTSVTGKATTIGENAFNGRSKLTEISFPLAETIGPRAFQGCSMLETVSLPKAITISADAFYNCTSLSAVSIPKATTIGNAAFSYCTSLTAVSFPDVITIGEYPFQYCTALEMVSLPNATSFGIYAFRYTGTKPLTITLGSTVPALGTGMFLGVGAKPVTVKVPSDADAWNDKTGTFTGVENKDDGPHWGEGFRGLGWYPNGSGYRYDGVLNTNITVNIETYEP